MGKRYELPDAVWDLVADICYESRRRGRPRTDDRLMINGVPWGLCSGAAWRDMPERFGPWPMVDGLLRLRARNANWLECPELQAQRLCNRPPGLRRTAHKRGCHGWRPPGSG